MRRAMTLECSAQHETLQGCALLQKVVVKIEDIGGGSVYLPEQRLISSRRSGSQMHRGEDDGQISGPCSGTRMDIGQKLAVHRFSGQINSWMHWYKYVSPKSQTDAHVIARLSVQEQERARVQVQVRCRWSRGRTGEQSVCAVRHRRRRRKRKAVSPALRSSLMAAFTQNYSAA